MCATQGCSMADDEDADSLEDFRNSDIYENSKGDFPEMLAANCMILPGNGDPLSGLDSLSSDTLKVFPDDEAFHKLLMQSLLSSQGMVKLIARSIDAAVLGQASSGWMNYYKPYLGVYSSPDDSRSKQWNLEQDAEYNGEVWAYHLTITDLPSSDIDGSQGEKAVELFYNESMKKGVMIFSPTDFNAVRFPVKIFGNDMRGILTFSSEGSVSTNELYLTNIGVNNNVKYIRNIYLGAELSNDCVAIKAMVDFPALWFDNKENGGYTISAVGACDMSTLGAVMYAGIVRNSSKETAASTLIVNNPSDEVLESYYPKWENMMEEAAKAAKESAAASDTTATEGIGSGVGGVVQSVDSRGDKVAETIEKVSEEYGKPGYYINGEYVPTSDVGDKGPYLRALNKSMDLMEAIFPISPYKNSVNQIEWSPSEKSR